MASQKVNAFSYLGSLERSDRTPARSKTSGLRNRNQPRNTVSIRGVFRVLVPSLSWQMIGVVDQKIGMGRFGVSLLRTGREDAIALCGRRRVVDRERFVVRAGPCVRRKRKQRVF